MISNLVAIISLCDVSNDADGVLYHNGEDFVAILLAWNLYYNSFIHNDFTFLNWFFHSALKVNISYEAADSIINDLFYFYDIHIIVY